MPKAQSRAANSAKIHKLAKPDKKKSNKTARPEKKIKKPETKPVSSKSQISTNESRKRDSEKSEKATASPVDLARPESSKQLVNNDEEVRRKAFDAVKQLSKTKRTSSETDSQKSWKGSWYTMWHSDTPLVQQALARDSASSFGDVATKNYDAFVRAFWFIMVREWGILDQWRINKFYMSSRLVLGSLLGRVAASNWDEEAIADFKNFMTDAEIGPLSFSNTKVAHASRLHLIDIYVDELSKSFSSGMPSVDVIRAMLSPMTDQSQKSNFKHIKKHVREEVMDHELLVEWGVVEPKPEPEEQSEESDFEAFD